MRCNEHEPDRGSPGTRSPASLRGGLSQALGGIRQKRNEPQAHRTLDTSPPFDFDCLISTAYSEHTMVPQQNSRQIEMLYIFFVTDRPGTPQGSFPYDLVDRQMDLGGELIKYKEQNRQFVFDKIPNRAESDFVSKIPDIVAQRHPGCHFAAKSFEVAGKDDKQYFVVVFRPNTTPEPA
jgi:hypothetical protein